jgi:uncharacterized protein
MAAAYSSAKAKVANEKEFKAEQLKWMKLKRNACEDSVCLLNEMEDRIQNLSAL